MLSGFRLTRPRMTTAPFNRGFALALLLLGSCGFAAAWVLLAIARDGQHNWMALLAALDAALLLRLARMPAGWRRAAWGVATTAVVIGLANWGIAAAQMGKVMGLLPWDSALKLGPHHAWTLIQLANDSADLAWLGAAVILAAIASR